MVSRLFNRSEVPPKAPRTSKPKDTPKRLPVTAKACEAVVSFVNLGWQISPWRDDALDEVETQALTKSLYAAAKSNVYLGNIIVRLTSATSEGQLIACVGAIAATRLAKHQIIPEIAGVFAYTINAGIASGDPEVVASGLDDLGAGSARRAGGLDGNGQNDVTGNAGQPAEIQHSFADEIGYVSMAEVYADQSSEPNGLGEGGSGRISPATLAAVGRKPRSRVSLGDPPSV